MRVKGPGFLDISGFRHRIRQIEPFHTIPRKRPSAFSCDNRMVEGAGALSRRNPDGLTGGNSGTYTITNDHSPQERLIRDRDRQRRLRDAPFEAPHRRSQSREVPVMRISGVRIL